ncbi:hypothetical protein [Kineococcus indalonis]|uniref:hypothetical protein n=1 Tax=Kineococcus indalonis TaxID=2696566 RepID=UPI001F0F7329|nr:hypothetical protein [Kineococcus indalonis]
MSEEIFVDAAAPVVRSDQHPLAFFKSTRPGTWLYASRAGRMARDGDRYRLGLVRKRRNQPSPSGGLELVTQGGALAAQIDIAALLPTPEDEAAWSETVRQERPFFFPGGGGVRFRPLGIRNGRMTISGLEGLVADPAAYREVPVGLQTTVPINLPLTADGADTLWRVLGTPVGFPIAVRFDYDYDVLYPGAHYRITANTRKVHEFFSLNVKARASYFGLVGGEGDVSVLRDELTGSGAVLIEWLVRPEGFDDARVAQLQNSIVDTFAKSALQMMVEEVVTDTEAPDPDGFFGGVSVKLKDVEEVATLDLSGEYRQNDLRTEVFSFSFSFQQLGLLPLDQYGVDVTGDNMLPITANLGKDPEHVQRYALQYGYVRADGTVQSDRAEATGADGLLLKGVVQWDPRDPRPERTDLQFLVDWEDLEWEDYTTALSEDNGDSGVLFQFTPGNFVRVISVLSDFGRSAPGAFASLEWRTALPPHADGTPAKDYSGGVIYEGTGVAGAADRFTVEFPYDNATAAQARFLWEAFLVEADGTVLTANGDEPLAQASTVLAVRARLRPAPRGAAAPRALAVLHSSADAPAPGAVPAAGA